MMQKIFMVLLCIVSAACFLIVTSDSSVAGDYVYKPPKQLDDGWKVSTLEAEGMDAEIITRLTNKVIDGKLRGIHSILIVKNGAIVYEAYFGSYGMESLHTIYSITKSVTSGLIGIAIDQGYIDGVTETVGELLPKYSNTLEDTRFKDVTIEQLLTMSSGLDWDEWSYPYHDSRNSEYYQVRSGDWVKYVLELPMRDDPGSRWIYNTGGVHVLSAIIKYSTRLGADDFAEKYLFKPLGITEFKWNKDPKGFPCTGGTHGGLKLKTRDIAKFGMVFMREGEWNGKRVISKEWIRESTARHITTVRKTGYGYLWWLASYTIKNKQIDMIYGAGYGGQSLALVPELDLMYVLTCWGQEEDADIFAPMIMIINSALNE